MMTATLHVSTRLQSTMKRECLKNSLLSPSPYGCLMIRSWNKHQVDARRECWISLHKRPFPVLAPTF